MKKILKKILWVVLVLLVIFLLIGLFVPKVEYTTEVTVNEPIEEVWQKYNDLNTLSEWIPEVISIKPIKETPNTVGSQYEMVVESGGSSITMVETITAFKEMEEVGLSFDAGNMIKNDIVYFSGDSLSTTIKGNHTCKGNNAFNRSLFAFFKGMFTDIDQTYMNQFKAWAEGDN